MGALDITHYMVPGLQKYTVGNLIAMYLFSLGMIKAYDMDFDGHKKFMLTK